MRICLIKFTKSSRFVKAICLPVLLVCTVSCTSVLDDMADGVSGIVGEEGTLSCVFSGGTVENCLSEETNGSTVPVETVEAIEDDAFPTLGEVPESPRSSSTVEDLEKLTEGLVADREHAKYTNEVLRSSYATSGDKLSKIPEYYDSNTDQDNSQRQDNVISRQSSKTVTDNSLAEERRIISVESASNAVLQQENISKVQRIRVNKGNKGVRSVGMGNQNGIMEVSKFREIFDHAFESSGAAAFKDKFRRNDIEVVSKPTLRKVEKLNIENFDGSSKQNEILLLKNRIQLAKSTEDSLEQASLSFQVASIPFAVGSASIGGSGRAILKKVVKFYEQFGGIVRVIGHASQRTREMDPDSHQWVNFNISMDRAENTAISLARLGIPADSIIIMARSDREQLSREHMPSSESENRRADIYIEY